MNIRTATTSDAQAIIDIAEITWQKTYSTIISQEQINYMLQLFYNIKTIQEQINDSTNHFFIAEENNVIIGYAQLVPTLNNQVYKLSKLYILPNQQGKQVGKKLLVHSETFLKQKKITTLTLNVNRQNPALSFYIKMNFNVIETIDIPLDKYWLNDYIMEKIL